MPILYAQPDPVVPGISAAYGAAQQWSQDAPTIAGIAEHSASLQQQGAGRADQLRFAYAQANAQAQNEQANRYAVSQAANANREQGALDLGAQLTSQGNLAELHSNTQQAMQNRGAEIQNWLMGQDLSQKETMRLQQMRGAIADVQESKLPEDQKQDMIMRLKTGIDPLDQRMKASQARNQESLAQEHAAQTEMELAKAKKLVEFNKLSAGEKIRYELTPEAQAEIDSQNLTPFERDAAIASAKAAGKYKTYLLKPDGGLEHIKPDVEKMAKEEHPSGLTAGEYRKIYTDTLRRVEKLSDAVPNKPWSREQITAETEKDMREIHKLPGNFEEYHKMTQVAGRRSPAAGGAQSALPGPAELQKEMKDENKPTASFQSSFQQLEARPDLSPEVKRPVMNNLAMARTLLEKAGGLKNVKDEAERKFILDAARAFENLPPPPPVQQQQQAPPAPSPPPGVPAWRRFGTM